MTPANERLQQAVRAVNHIAAQELAVHRHKYNVLGCKPHPHDGAHLILCACGKARGEA